jgi:hypothetical protein
MDCFGIECANQGGRHDYPHYVVVAACLRTVIETDRTLHVVKWPAAMHEDALWRVHRFSLSGNVLP